MDFHTLAQELLIMRDAVHRANNVYFAEHGFLPRADTRLFVLIGEAYNVVREAHGQEARPLR